MKITYLIFSLFFVFQFSGCVTKIVDLKTENPKLYKELIRTYNVPSEERYGELETLEFTENTNKTIKGKISNFNLEQCTWFFDRKPKLKDLEEDSPPKKINLNCNERFYIIDFSNKKDLISKLNYNGVYKEIYDQFKKGIILEASCSFSSISTKTNEEIDPDLKNVYVECYPYPHDVNEYLKNQNREVIAAYFFYLDKPESLKQLIEESKDFAENERIFEILSKEFSTLEKQKNQSASSLIGRDFEFSNCEYIDLKEISIPNSKGVELKKKINALLNSNLQSSDKKEELKDAIEEYINCGNRCYSKEKEFLAFFEIWNNIQKSKVLLTLKFKNKSEIGNFRRFQKYKVTGILHQIDFSETGKIEKIHLETVDLKKTN